jgi:hypothetical protein
MVATDDSKRPAQRTRQRQKQKSAASQRAGERVKLSVTSFLRDRLRLMVNEAKSAVDRPWRRKFLGFSICRKDLRITMAPTTLQRVKDKIRSLTQRNAAVSIAERITTLSRYLAGWMGYYALSECPGHFKGLDQWMRRRLRMCQWKQWKLRRTRVRKLRALGLSEHSVWEATSSGKGYWCLAKSPLLHQAMNNAYWRANGLMPLIDRYEAVRRTW